MNLAAIDFGTVHTDAIIQNVVGSVLYFLVGRWCWPPASSWSMC